MSNTHFDYATAAFSSANADAEDEFNAAVRADAHIQATLALAYEQRTANLIAMWINPETTLMDLRTGTQRTAGIGADLATDFLHQILERLGVPE